MRMLPLLVSNTRATLALVVVTFALATTAGLLFVGRGGAISENYQQRAIQLLVDIYGPLTAVVLAFYFGDGRRTTARDSGIRFTIALLVVTVWCLAPVAMFALIRIIEDVIPRLEALRTWGESATLAVLGFYFAKR